VAVGIHHGQVDAASVAAQWPPWALTQLRHAVRLAARIEGRPQRIALAPELYRLWFTPIVGRPIEPGRPWRPLPGLYRAAHAGSGSRVVVDGVATVERNDVICRDGWWRTWGDAWRPTHSRAETVRLIMSPRPDALAQFVATITAALLDQTAPWLLACATDPRRLRRCGAAVLHVTDPEVLRPHTVAALRPLLRATAPPLALPLHPGIAVAHNPDNGMSFGEHRCHLIALALRTRPQPHAPLRAIADVFTAHGIDPARPHESRP
jgi:hypothetical protein